MAHHPSSRCSDDSRMYSDTLWVNPCERMSKEEFKIKWESNDNGGGITNDDMADLAIEWGLNSRPRTCRIEQVIYSVLKHAETVDAEEFRPKLN